MSSRRLARPACVANTCPSSPNIAPISTLNHASPAPTAATVLAQAWMSRRRARCSTSVSPSRADELHNRAHGYGTGQPARDVLPMVRSRVVTWIGTPVFRAGLHPGRTESATFGRLPMPERGLQIGAQRPMRRDRTRRPAPWRPGPSCRFYRSPPRASDHRFPKAETAPGVASPNASTSSFRTAPPTSVMGGATWPSRRSRREVSPGPRRAPAAGRARVCAAPPCRQAHRRDPPPPTASRARQRRPTAG